MYNNNSYMFEMVRIGIIVYIHVLIYFIIYYSTTFSDSVNIDMFLFDYKLKKKSYDISLLWCIIVLSYSHIVLYVSKK